MLFGPFFLKHKYVGLSFTSIRFNQKSVLLILIFHLPNFKAIWQAIQNFGLAVRCSQEEEYAMILKKFLVLAFCEVEVIFSILCYGKKVRL